MKKLLIMALIFVLTLGMLAGCRGGTAGNTDASNNMGSSNASGNMGGANGNATDGDGFIGESGGNQDQRSGGMIPGPIHY